MEGDHPVVVVRVFSVISIHSLRMEGDEIVSGDTIAARPFQSTPSAWRETVPPWMLSRKSRFQSTPSAWRETCQICTNKHFLSISIHSLRMEGDKAGADSAGNIRNFNPLPPHGGRPRETVVPPFPSTISIHSLRMEGDRRRSGYSRHIRKFQSTPSAWRETNLSPAGQRHWHISIHSLRMEGDRELHCRSCR